MKYLMSTFSETFGFRKGTGKLGQQESYKVPNKTDTELILINNLLYMKYDQNYFCEYISKCLRRSNYRNCHIDLVHLYYGPVLPSSLMARHRHIFPAFTSRPTSLLSSNTTSVLLIIFTFRPINY
jgi:hypothetical protein